MEINPLATLRQLKGAPLSVLIALTIVKPRHVSSSWLSGCTGYSHDAVSAATWYLKEFGFVDCDSRRSNWRLSENAQQLPLPVSMLNPEIVQDAEKPHPDVLTYLKLYLNGKEKLSEESSSSFNVRDAEKPHLEESYRICRNLLLNAGIHDPMAENLCKLDHVDFEYLDAHITKARQDETDIGLLIHRIRSADPAPNVHSVSYFESESYRQKFISGVICDQCFSHPCTCEEEE